MFNSTEIKFINDLVDAPISILEKEKAFNANNPEYIEPQSLKILKEIKKKINR